MFNLILQLGLILIIATLAFALIGMKKVKDSLKEKNIELESRIVELIDQEWELHEKYEWNGKDRR
jgi:hypothetical protein